jgi:hypothetical protein
MPSPGPPTSGPPAGYPTESYAPTSQPISPSYPPQYPPGAPYSGAMPSGLPSGLPSGPPPPMPGDPMGPRRKGRGATIAAGVLAVVAAVVLVGTLVLVATGTFNEDEPNNPPASNDAQSREPSANSSEPTTKATGPVVQPAGAPYSYRVPNGFSKTDQVTVSRGGNGAKYQSGVLPGGVSGEDLVAVTVYELPVDSSTLSDSQIRTELDRLVAGLADNGATEPETSTIADARTWKYRVTVDATVADSYFLFAGKTELQILCQWKTKETEIKRGCQEVLDTLEITPT